LDGESNPAQSSILPWPSGAVTADPARVVFDRKELTILLGVYGRMVAAGEWRDYAIDFTKDRAVFPCSGAQPNIRFIVSRKIRN